jgi:hypothetical protein
MDEPLETTEAFKKLSREACQQSGDWILLPEGQAYKCQRTDVHNKVVTQFFNDHVCSHVQPKAHQANVDQARPDQGLGKGWSRHGTGTVLPGT